MALSWGFLSNKLSTKLSDTWNYSCYLFVVYYKQKSKEEGFLPWCWFNFFFYFRNFILFFPRYFYYHTLGVQKKFIMTFLNMLTLYIWLGSPFPHLTPHLSHWVLVLNIKHIDHTHLPLFPPSTPPTSNGHQVLQLFIHYKLVTD
jgi:hypothetical protein